MTSKISENLWNLAPTNLVSRRSERYDGGGFHVRLNYFAPEDIALVLQLYQSVKKTYDLWLYMQESPNYPLARKHIMAEFGERRFFSLVHGIGGATYSLKKPNKLLRQVVHDVRGGGLTALMGYAEMQSYMPDESDTEVKNAILKARDHAKLMRNAIIDLDPIVREADESLKVHPVDDFVNKWHNTIINIADKTVTIHVECIFEGSVTNRCLETSAIDRILYNYVNNAARFSADNTIKMTIFSTNDTLVRWVVSNTLADEQLDWLRENTNFDLTQLFKGGLTRGGHGIGLAACTEVIATCFGLYPPEKAVEDGYLGAKVIADTYHGWFHWPIYHPNPDDEVCACGH